MGKGRESEGKKGQFDSIRWKEHALFLMQFTLSLNGVYTIQNSNFTLKRSTRVKIGRCEAKTADCGPGVKCRLSVKWRPSINCSRGRVFKAKKIPQIHVNDHLLDTCFHKSFPCSFETSSTIWKHNSNLKPLFPSGRPHASFFDTRDRELVQRYDV